MAKFDLITDKYGRKGWAFQVALIALFMLVALNAWKGINVDKAMENLLYLFGAFVFGNGFEHFTKRGKATQGANAGEQPHV